MNLSQIIIKKHEELISGLADHPIFKIDIADIENLITDSEKAPYDYWIAMSPKSAMTKLLIESAKAYGECKWNEAVEATRNSICEDKSTPPKFIP